MLKLSPREAIQQIGHRDYVGGKWEEIGLLQFNFLLTQGLKPQDVFLDIACGSLRAGVHFIQYLNAGNYLGIEKEQDLIDAGIEKELGSAVYDQKKPEIIASSRFEFEKFSKKPSYALAHALFTHLTAEDIQNCMSKLRACVAPGCKFYVTFFEAGTESRNPNASHDHTYFKYTPAQMSAFGTQTGWIPLYIGEWKHPRGQKMIQYTAI